MKLTCVGGFIAHPNTYHYFKKWNNNWGKLFNTLKYQYAMVVSPTSKEFGILYEITMTVKQLLMVCN